MKKVYISLTTISERVSEIHETILSILAQTYDIDLIYLYISKDPFLLDKGILSIPPNIKMLQVVDNRFIIEYVENQGSYRKLLPILKRYWNEDCIIITLDDDKIYEPDMVSKMVTKYIDTGEKFIIANRAFVKLNGIFSNLCQSYFNVPKKTCKYILKLTKNNASSLSYNLSDNYDFIKLITFYEGNDGVLYSPKFFTPLIFEWDVITRIAKSHDDFWFKMNSLINGYGVISMNEFDIRPCYQRPKTKKSALHLNVNIGSYDTILNLITRWLHSYDLIEQGFIQFIKKERGLITDREINDINREINEINREIN